LAGIINFTEIFIYYRHPKILPSAYLKLCSATPLPETNMEIHLTQAISELDLAEAIIEEMEHPILQRKPVNNHGTTQPVLGTT